MALQATPMPSFFTADERTAQTASAPGFRDGSERSA
jgi:hypothetical protein